MPAAPATNPRDTPAMRQYAKFKARHPGCVLMFRIGDFYEMFDDDAVVVSKAIGLTLTQRTAGVPMCGVPFHQLEAYLRKMIAAGMRVAVCEQVQDAAEVKAGSIVERAVTRVLTPGTLVDEGLLSEDESSALASVWTDSGGASAHVAVAELSTGAMVVLSCPAEQVAGELARRRVREVIYPESEDRAAPGCLAQAKALGIALSAAPPWSFRPAEASEALRAQFGVATLAAFGLGDDDPLTRAAGAIVRYLRTTQALDDESPRAGGKALAHLRPPRREANEAALVLDAASLRALEVDRTLRGGAGASASGAAGDASLVGIFAGAKTGSGSCRTPMGKRLLREWLVRPPAHLEAIAARQSAVGTLVEDRTLAEELARALEGVQDVHRIAARVALRRATPRDLSALACSLARVEALSAAAGGAGTLRGWRAALEQVRAALVPLARRIEGLCVPEAPPHLREGGLIRDGVDAELDEARALQRDNGAWVASYQARLVAEHDLPNLKVGFNKIFGYYIELPKAQAARAPAVFARRQTLTNAERYITPELKDYEDKVTTAQRRALAREQALFDDLCVLAAGALDEIARFGQCAGELDVLLAFSDKAVARAWVRPRLSEQPALRIVQGRHPVLDELLDGSFVPNDLSLGEPGPLPGEDASAPAAGAGERRATLALITGPNMAGKSTFIRQTALLVLLAHAGSFVPADACEVGLCDRLFTRIGADDALHAGQSTFMVEMVETAAILHQATPRSLVVLDEIGRGTSTLDGLSLAWAIAERLAGGGGGGGAGDNAGPRTLFATHYHELTSLDESHAGRVKNLQVQVREWGEQIVFLHRIVPGKADRSYGLHVAKLAGVPREVVERAQQVLASLSVEQAGTGGAGTKGPGITAVPPPSAPPAPPVPPPGAQLGLFTEYLQHPAVDRLRELKLEALSPMQAFDELRKLKEASAER